MGDGSEQRRDDSTPEPEAGRLAAGRGSRKWKQLDKPPPVFGASFGIAASVLTVQQLEIKGIRSLFVIVLAALSGFLLGLAATCWERKRGVGILSIVVGVVLLCFGGILAQGGTQAEINPDPPKSPSTLEPLKVPLTNASISFNVTHQLDYPGPYVSSSDLNYSPEDRDFLRNPQGKGKVPFMDLLTRVSSDQYSITLKNPLSYPVRIASLDVVDKTSPSISETWIELGGGAVAPNPVAILDLDRDSPTLRDIDGREFLQTNSIVLAPQEQTTILVEVRATKQFHSYYFRVRIDPSNQQSAVDAIIFDRAPGIPFTISGLRPLSDYVHAWYRPNVAFRELSVDEKRRAESGDYPRK